MKKNLILTAILGFMLVFTYFYQEVGSKKAREALEIKNRIVNLPLPKVDTIELKNTKLLRVNGSWIVGELDFPASEDKVNNLLNHILSIHQLKQLPADEDKQYFTTNDHEILFGAMGKIWKYRLGDVSEFTGNFYFQDMNTQPPTTFLAIDTSEYAGLYKTELELLLNKYLNFKDLIVANPVYYADKNIFRSINFDQLEKVKIDNQWNRWFELDLNRNVTTPQVMNGLEYLDLKAELKKLVSEVKIEKLMDRDEITLNTPICSVELSGQNGQKLELQVYGQAGKESGIYVTSSEFPNWIFKMGTASRDFFFSNVQKYWNKKLFFASDLKNVERLNFKIGDEKNMYSFYVEDVEDFEIESDDKRVGTINKANTNFLFHLLFSLTQFEQAYTVLEELPPVENKLLSLRVNILDHDLEVVITSDKVYLVNKSDKVILEYLFPAGDYKIDSLEDFFALN